MPPKRMPSHSVSSSRRRSIRRIEEDDDEGGAVVSEEMGNTTNSQSNPITKMDTDEELGILANLIGTIDTTLTTVPNQQQQHKPSSQNAGVATSVNSNAGTTARPITAASLGQLQYVPPLWLVSSTNIVSAMNSVNKSNREHSQMLCLMNLIDSERVVVPK